MREINITANDAGRRLDRFLRKYLKEASLSDIYKIIRKDVRVDGKHRRESYILSEGEVMSLYISDDTLKRLTGGGSKDIFPASGNAPDFRIIYEDENILIADKPYGLLTHGDSHEKKDHLTNRVKDYLIASGSYNPRSEKVFTPAPVNRLDRNTSGLVLFGKTSEAMRELTRMIREDQIRKFYLCLSCGIIDEEELHLRGSLTKDSDTNKVKVTLTDDASDPEAKEIETIVHPLEYAEFGAGYVATLCDIELVTGRTHQIRAHLAAAGHPLAGDSKYGLEEYSDTNRYLRDKTGLSTQFLHAYRTEFTEDVSISKSLGYLAGRSFKSPLPARLSEIFWSIYG